VGVTFLFDTSVKTGYPEQVIRAFAMATWTAYLPAAKADTLTARYLASRPALLNTLIWLGLLAGLVAFKPAEAKAAKGNKTVKEAPKVKNATSAARKPLHKFLPRPPKVLERDHEPAADLDPLEIRDHVVHRARPGDTLVTLLKRFGLAEREKQLWTNSLKKSFSTVGLASGREIHFYFDKPVPGQRPAGARLRALEIELTDDLTLTLERGTGGILAEKREKPYEIELKTVAAYLNGSLFEDGQRAGIHATLLSQLTDIFTWDIDLEKEIRSGDTLKILYEKKSRNGQNASRRILAAELTSNGQKFTAIYFEREKGQGGYYNLEGRSLARAFLRFPLEFASITSQFADSRFHPLLKVNMPHNGVDFAAPRGTPVRAIGDGKVAQAGWNGAYGKLIEIQHDSSYTSRYAHLDSFVKGLREGTVVKKGQIIGYVGSTGRATGPHLHFELYKDQQYVDPLTANFGAEDRIEPALLKTFESQKETFLVKLISAPQS
jgi:murein DD-endopeptidase MepM/ murein hydrolase activator NlpD